MLNRRSFLGKFAGVVAALAGARLLPTAPETPKGLLPAGQPMGDFLTTHEYRATGLWSRPNPPNTYEVTIGGEPVVLGPRESFWIEMPGGFVRGPQA